MECEFYVRPWGRLFFCLRVPERDEIIKMTSTDEKIKAIHQEMTALFSDTEGE
jgi:hypothetical protein